MNQPSPRYCIDTSALSDGWTRYYRPIVHKTLWEELLPGLIGEGRLIAPIEVQIELEALGGDLYDWLNDQESALLVQQTDVTQRNMRAIVARFPEFVPQQARKEWADPWVIATAQEYGCVVVTGEKFASGGQNEPPRIPDICQHFGVECLYTDNEPTPGLHFMMERERWRF